MYLLLGKDRTENVFSDFGGCNNESDRGSEIQTAMREFLEESCGVILDKKALKKRMSCKDNYIVIQSKTVRGYEYIMYLVEIPYDEKLRSTFRKVVSHLKYIKVPKQYLEKSDICFISLENVLFHDTVLLRKVFANTLQNNRQTFIDLEKSLQKSMGKYV